MSEDQKLVVFIEYGFGGIPQLHVAEVIKETDKTIKMVKSDIDSYCYKSVLNKSEGMYKIVTKKTAMRAFYFARGYYSTYSEIKKTNQEKYKINILELFGMCGTEEED